ncbi:hypothetical protein CRM22_007726 [Opisthorchis felineus]|uniref:RING-type domain-containing protein n=1 Tax=Opisthorchis felineus TaxID=147828 RepID=A0A4S2LMU2_OPIFE|nr:hypothetical protein CRM22_007726 [Opisthorchis felineus]
MTDVSTAPVTDMASRLVETVMINVDDFADSFLTCGTCFTGYDTCERAAKLLPCSHTVCRSCLDRILETQSQATSLRCPICREDIPVPAGGASSFPPAFIVNQLLDLLATQRRDVVPKCRIHSNQELLFCETCDVVFCTECRGRSHAAHPSGCESLSDCDTANVPLCLSNEHSGVGTPTTSGTSALNHNVISFNVAIKRCTEIMLYKMHLCIQELDRAQSAVSAELDRLSINKSLCVESINSKFSEIIALVERRQAELLDTVSRLANDKHRALVDQLALIESEREAIRRECNSLKGILDVRSISKAISYLNDKLDTVTSLTEPRENAFLHYQDCMLTRGLRRGQRQRNALTSSTSQPPTAQPMLQISDRVPNTTGELSAVSSSPLLRQNTDTSSNSTGSNLIDIARCLAAFGRILVSTTYPALCTAHLPSQLVTYLIAKASIQAVDYYGRPQSTGGTDPIDVVLTDPEGRSVPTELFDMGDGSYELLIRPVTAGLHQLSVQILSRPIRGSPFQLSVRRAQQRSWCFTEGSDGRGLIQPFAVAYGPYPRTNGECSSDGTCFIYLLDTGNSRLLVINPDTGALHTTLVGAPLVGQAATGIAWSPEGLWIVNWRSKRVYLLDPWTDKVVQSIHSSLFIEPTSTCRCPLTGSLYVADNGAGCVFLCNPVTGSTRPFVGVGVQTSSSNEPNLSGSHTTPRTAEQSGDRSPHSASTLFSPEPRNFRRITGLCATDSGELVLSTGSTIRVFSKDGVQINLLTPPIVRTENTPSMGRTTMPAPRAVSEATYFERSPVGSTLTLNTGSSRDARFSLNTGPLGVDRCSLSGLPPAQSNTAFSPRGQFGGVFAARPPISEDDFPSDRLGICLLASYSDRRRSGVVVWPQNAWCSIRNESSSPRSQRSVQSSTSPNPNLSDRQSCDSPNCVDFPRPVDCCPPYLIEAEPGLRRLAGLVALADSRQLVVVDQGAQSLCRLRYA